MRELAQRTSDGITVTLLHDPAAERIIVTVTDDREPDTPWEIVVPPDKAHDAFLHPFAYAYDYPPDQPRRTRSTP